jgi:cytosine deaminase
MGLDVSGIRPGADADLILTGARNFTELFSRPHEDRTVLRGGAPLEPPPDYAEIDAPEGLA